MTRVSDTQPFTEPEANLIASWTYPQTHRPIGYRNKNCQITRKLIV